MGGDKKGIDYYTTPQKKCKRIRLFDELLETNQQKNQYNQIFLCLLRVHLDPSKYAIQHPEEFQNTSWLKIVAFRKKFHLNDELVLAQVKHYFECSSHIYYKDSGQGRYCSVIAQETYA